MEKPASTSREFKPIQAGELPRIDWLPLWILFSAWCPLSGWTLSLLGCLNATGTGIALLVFAVALIFLAKPLELIGKSNRHPWTLVRSRWVFPKIWLLLTVLALIGGILYTPSNYDYLTYRFPRLLYWCGDHHWSWISTADDRMNLSGTQMEWMMAPLFLLFKTDRLFFLINFISYLFIPGLVFSVFKGLGISKRISWWWMWVLPCGFCYILQAGSAGNDSFAVVYFFAALHYLFRARISSPAKNLALSLLAIGLLTGAKASNLPLALPWLILLFFSRDSLVKAAPAPILVAVLAAVAASFLPVGLLNRHYTGDFFGDPTNQGGMKITGPIGGVVGNLLLIATSNLGPPVWPHSISLDPLIPSPVKAMILHSFPRFGLSTEEIPAEESTGVGLGIILGLIPFGLTAAIARLFNRRLLIAPNRQAFYIIGGLAIACLVYMAKIGTEAVPRVVAPYYPLLVGACLVIASLDGRVIHRRLITCAGVVAMLCALPVLILSPSRPLFPVQTVFHILKDHIPAHLADRFQGVYTAYASRATAFEPITSLISDEPVVGLVQRGNDSIASLWRPFGSRKLVEVTPDDSPDQIRAQGFRLVVVSNNALQYRYHVDIDSLLSKWTAHLVAEREFILTLHQGKEVWYVIRLP
jgi:hypothetical protein